MNNERLGGGGGGGIKTGATEVEVALRTIETNTSIHMSATVSSTLHSSPLEHGFLQFVLSSIPLSDCTMRRTWVYIPTFSCLPHMRFGCY